MILSAGCAGVVAAAGPFTWGVVFRPGWGAYRALGAWWLIGRIGPAVRYLAFWRAQVMRLPTKKRWCFL